MQREIYKSDEKQLLFVNAQRKKLNREDLKVLLQQTSPEMADLSLLSSSSSQSEAASVKSVENLDAGKTGVADKVEPEKRKVDKSLFESRSGESVVNFLILHNQNRRQNAGNTKGGSITVPLTSCLTGLD
jgi:hypothetical protein